MTLDLPPDRNRGDVIASDDIDKLSAAARALDVGKLSRQPTAPRVVVIGDSIDQGGDTPLFVSGSLWSHLAWRTKGRFHLVANEAVGGRTTQQMIDGFAAEVPRWAPDVVVIGGATNDINGAVPPSTTKAHYATLLALVLNLGAIPIFRTTPPSNAFDGSNHQAIASHNDWITKWASRQGYDVLDVWRLWVDPASGGYRPGLTDDNTHPSAAAVELASAALATRLPSIFRDGVRLPAVNVDSANIFRNPLALTIDPANNLPDGWFVPDTSKATFTPADVGQWATARNAQGEGAALYSPTGTGFAEGDRMAAVGRFKITGTQGTVAVYDGQSYANLVTPVASREDVADGVFYIEFTVPKGTTSLGIYIGSYGDAGEVSVAQPAIYKLT